MRAATNTGVRRYGLVGMVLQVSVYAGVPVAMNAARAAKAALEKRCKNNEAKSGQ